MKKNLKRIISLFLIAITFVLSGCSLVPDNDTPTEPPQTVTYTVDYTYSSFNMEEGQSGTPSLTFKVNGQAGDPMALTYTSSNTAVATVNSAGLITAVGAGTCTITASIGSGENETKDTIVISVEGTPEYFVDFTGTLIYIEAGQQATPQIIFKIDGEISSSSYLSFTSSNTAIATVNSSGVVTAKKEGTCTITASIGSGTKKASDTITIFVSPAPQPPNTWLIIPTRQLVSR